MSQSDFGTINPNSKSGTQLATDLNDWRDAMHSLHKGASRPSYASQGTLWLDDSAGATAVKLKYYDGSDDILILTLNETANSQLVELAGSDGSSLTGVLSPTGDGSGLSGVLLPAGDGSGLSGIHIQGKQTIWMPAGAMIPRTTSGAASGTVESTTHKVMLNSFDFDKDIDEYVQFTIRMPKGWDASTVTAQFVWSHPSTATNYGVRFFIQGLAYADDDALDTAFGAAVGHTADTGGTTDDIYITPETGAITLGNGAAKSEFVTFQIYRDVSDAGDTLAVDARLHGVSLFYTTDAGDDA